MTEIKRPETNFDGPSHTYTKPDGSKYDGVSSVAKMGAAEDAFSIGSLWGWKLGYDGMYDIVEAEDPYLFESKQAAREELIKKGLAPWSKRDQASERGNWVHDILEILADGYDQQFAIWKIINQLDGERRGHANALLQWYLDYRPEFVSTEVQVVSEEHGFAGRYDIRCKIHSSLFGGGDHTWELCLVDLKTSKHIYPLQHYAQLEGYELASVEMGFPATDYRMVLNTHPDGTYDVGTSYATADDFLAYLGAYRAIRSLKDRDPELVAKRAVEEALLKVLPATSREISQLDGFSGTPQEIGRILGGLRKRGLVEQDEQSKVWSACQ